MKQNLLNRLIAMWCVGTLLMTVPSMNVLADDIQEAANVSEIIDDSTSEFEISDEYSDESLTEDEIQGDDGDVSTSATDESVDDAYYAADESEGASYNAVDDSVDTEPIEEAARDDSSVEEDTTAIIEAEDNNAEELVGANTWTVGKGVTAKIVKKGSENVLYFTSKGGTLWDDWKSKIGEALSTVSTITFTADSTKMYFPVDSSYLFYGEYLKSIKRIDLKKADTSKVKSMNAMFSWCEHLIELDVSGFNTSNVTDMERMFSHCETLTDLDVSGFKTSKVTNMKEMFCWCYDLTNLDVSGFDTTKVTNMSLMFICCSHLTNLDVSGFDTSNVTDMRAMFSSCVELTNLDVSGFDTSNVENMRHMFFWCESLRELDVSGFDTSNVKDMSDMFTSCWKLKKLDVSGFNTMKVTDMSSMFDCCLQLTSLDVSGFNTSNSIRMNDMFFKCRSLTYLDVSGFDTSNVTDMSYMFYLCENLINLDVSGFDTTNVKNMERMFCGSSGLITLDVSGFNTSKVTDMSNMFSYCTGLKKLDLSGFNTSKVTNMNSMFEYCTGLKTIDFCGFNTSKVTYMGSMFNNCKGLKTLDVSSFDTSKVRVFEEMFKNCSSLTSLDLSSFEVIDSDNTYTVDMLYNCKNLLILKTPKKVFDDIELPFNMYDSTGKKYEILRNMSKSITLMKKVSISECDITLSTTTYTFDGNAKEPAVTVKYGDTTLTLGTDYTVDYKNNVNVGKATVTITGIGSYADTSNINFTIKQAVPGQAITIKNAKITGINRSYGYTGSTYTPNFKVVLNNKTLTANTDYTYTFEDNTNPGVAKLIINGKGTYHDTLIYEFVIVDCVAKPEVGKTYMLVPKNNPYGCLCTQGGKMVNNTKASITDQSSSESVKFVLKKSSDGNYKFMSAKCELVIAVQQNSTELGKGVVFYQNTAETEQNWKLYRKADNSWAIVNAVTGYSIATPTATADKGSAFIIAKTAASSLQRFYFVETTPVNASFDGTYSLGAARNKDYSVDIAAGSTEAGANVQLYKYNGTDAQKFTAMYSGSGYYRFVNKKSGMVLTVEENSKTNGANIIQSTWTGQSGQRWKFTENSDGTVTLTSGLGTVLHLHTNTIKNGMNITSRLPADTTAQRWFLKKA